MLRARYFNFKFQSFSLNFFIFLFYNKYFDGKICETIPQFNQKLKDQIRRLSSDAHKIIESVVNGSEKGVTYRELSRFVDKFGHRLTGTKALEESINYMVDVLKKETHDNVYTEDVTVPTWV